MPLNTLAKENKPPLHIAAFCGCWRMLLLRNKSMNSGPKVWFRLVLQINAGVHAECEDYPHTRDENLPLGRNHF